MKRLSILGVIVLSLFIVEAQGEAALIDLGNNSYGNESRMYQIYNALYGTNYSNNDAIESLENDSVISNGLFDPVWGTMTLKARYAGAGLTMKYYDSLGAHNIITNLPGSQIFYDSNSAPYIFTSNGPFYLSGQTAFGTWYSKGSLNKDNRYHFLVLNTPDPLKYLVGFEDMSSGSDWDYNDIVFEMKDPPVTAVPEPASLSLLGLGLAGLLRLRRRKE